MASDRNLVNEKNKVYAHILSMKEENCKQFFSIKWVKKSNGKNNGGDEWNCAFWRGTVNKIFRRRTYVTENLKFKAESLMPFEGKETF